MQLRKTWLSLVILAILAQTTMAAVDLVTIPRREATQLTIYNSEDITMVREHRLLTVKPGINRIQFTWANTLIDPTSIDFRILDHQDKVDLIDTTFPSGRNDALQWNIKSGMAGKLPVEIRYFTSGTTWKADYVGIANQDETQLNVTGYVRVMNNSDELYDNAQTRLVVGTINLVEKIADLARRPAPKGTGTANRPHNQEVLRGALELAEPGFSVGGGMGGGGGGLGQPIARSRAIRPQLSIRPRGKGSRLRICFGMIDRSELTPANCSRRIGPRQATADPSTGR